MNDIDEDEASHFQLNIRQVFGLVESAVSDDLVAHEADDSQLLVVPEEKPHESPEGHFVPGWVEGGVPMSICKRAGQLQLRTWLQPLLVKKLESIQCERT